MREIKFRARCSYGHEEWVYGQVSRKRDNWFITNEEGNATLIDPKTIGQYTGLKDFNFKEIYEGDILKGHWWNNGKKHRHVGRVAYVNNRFAVRGINKYLGFDDDYLNSTYEIVGNVYENPEFLGDKK